MSPIEKPPATCAAPREMMKTACLPQVTAVIDALHEPDLAMQEAGSEIIHHVGCEESESGFQNDAANVWRFMVDALRQNGRHHMAQTAGRAAE